MAANSPTDPPDKSTSAKKSRSKVERAVVWSLIGGLLIVMLLELRAYRRFQSAYDSLTAAIAADSEDNPDDALTEAGVKERLGNLQPQESESLDYRQFLASRVDTYVWPGLLKTRTFHIYYGPGENPDVVSVTLEKNRTGHSYLEQIYTEGDAEAAAAASENTAAGGK